ncbi:MAG: DUF2089 domain-containing protein [Candidatus Latescibacteria bacterium]|nr:DUF2089 domain-containing protein [Candidatus Latescibacterota bacterium]
MRKILECCPNCGRDLEITQLKCTSCETLISARYSPCRFCKLSQESLRLLEIFIKNRGNVKEMERELGLSYPTVRNKLDAVIKELGFEPNPAAEEDFKTQRRQILEQLEKGELKAAEAAGLLAKLKK